MKKLIVIFLFFCSFNTHAQKTGRIDSVYYLLDTGKTPVNDSMWDIHMEYPSVKLYSIQCPCLQYDQKPIFAYNITEVKGQTISKKKIKAIKLVSLADLIFKAKQFTAIGFKGRYAIFIIEPAGEKYIFYEVRLLRPIKSRNASIDYENVSPTDPTKLKKP